MVNSVKTSAESAKNEYRILESGEKGTLQYRISFFNSDDVVVSPWHSIPLHAGDGLFNFVCEIPRNSRAKFEVATRDANNPIKQDSKNGKPRSYGCDILWNYGMLPQTWEDPSHVNEECDGHIGDNDPVDVVEIGDRTANCGEIFSVKPIAALAMIDEGELDWKIIAISSEDSRCDLVNDVTDMEEHFPGTLDSIREWFRSYKTLDGKPLNKFALGEEAMDRKYTLNIIAQTHAFWKNLVLKSKEENNEIQLVVGDVPLPALCAKEGVKEGAKEDALEVAKVEFKHQSSLNNKRHQEEVTHDSKRVEISSS